MHSKGLNSSIWTKDGTLTVVTNLGLSGPGSNGNESVFLILWSSSTWASRQEQFIFILRTVIGNSGFLPLTWCAANVFYCPNQKGSKSCKNVVCKRSIWSINSTLTSISCINTTLTNIPCQSGPSRIGNEYVVSRTPEMEPHHHALFCVISKITFLGRSEQSYLSIQNTVVIFKASPVGNLPNCESP